MWRKFLAVCAALLLCKETTLAQTPAETAPVTVGQASSLPNRQAGSLPHAAAEEPAPAPVAGLFVDGCCRAHQRFWVMGDYLVGWIEQASLPPLVTTSPVATPRASAGVLGASTTSILFDGSVNDDARSGVRLGAGYRFDSEFGVEAGFMILESQSSFFFGSSATNPILARPFTNGLTGNPDAVLVAFPGEATGSIDIGVHSGNFYEAHLDLTQNVCDAEWFRLVGLFGYRFYRYDDGLRIRQSVFPTGPNFVPGTSILSDDDFGAQNEFHGLDLGWRAKFLWHNWSLDLLGKIAVGHLDREVNINGSQVTSVPGAAPLTRSGGVLALSSNIGAHSSGDWTVLPELGVTVGWQVRPNLWLRFGYSALLLSQIARASDQVDFTLNPNLFPPAAAPGGPGRPAFVLNREDVWLQALSFGVEFTY